MTDKLTVLCAGTGSRLEPVLQAALENVPYEMHQITSEQLPQLQNRRVLFALAVDDGGISVPICHLLSALRKNQQCLQGACVAAIIDGTGELYTKQLGRNLIFAANNAGAWLMGKPLLEATGSMQNLTIRARRLGIAPAQAYPILARELVQRLLHFSPHPLQSPKLLMLHASNQTTSNTLALGNAVCEKLPPSIAVQTLSVRNGTLHDCKGCSYKVCAHFAEQGSCFYGGAMVEDVYPAILSSDILLVLCPNYNDAIGANLMALINRLTSLTVNNLLEGKLLFGIVASGYSGGDLVAEQLLGALCLNKAFALPPRCCLLVTANDPGQAMQASGIHAQIDALSAQIAALAK